jgi:tripartite-type tricarboxylate transporter receptor subunit TctC
MKRKLASLTIIAVFILSSGIASWAEYPRRPVRLDVAFKAGGGMDTLARVFSKTLGDELGQPVVVGNKAGGGGSVGASHMKIAKPDGYTIGFNGDYAFTLNPLLGKTNYNLDDFDYIAALSLAKSALVSSPDKKPWQSWQDLVEAGKKAGSLTAASQLPWDKMALKAIAAKEGFSIEAVPTKGGAEMVPALLGGHVDFGWNGNFYKYAKSGKMTILAVCSSERLEDFPEVPTLRELGYDISLDIYVVMYAPKGLPNEVKERLGKAARVAWEHESFQSLVQDKMHQTVIFIPGEEFVKVLKTNKSANAALVEKFK